MQKPNQMTKKDVWLNDEKGLYSNKPYAVVIRLSNRICAKLLIRPDEVSSGIANTPILEIGDNSLRRAFEQRHVLIGSIA